MRRKEGIQLFKKSRLETTKLLSFGKSGHLTMRLFVKRIIPSLICIFFIATTFSCAKSQSRIQSYRYYENARRKPVAALVPLIVKDQNQKISWNVSQEITSQVHNKLLSKDELFLNPVHISERLKKKIESQDLVSLKKEDLAEFKSQNEFAVFMELIEHKEHSAYDSEYVQVSSIEESSPSFLTVKVRLRVFDLRPDEPKVLLQEILSYKQFIPFVERDHDYSKIVWGGDSYPASVYGRVHAKIEKDLVRQIENYITIAK